MKKIISFLLTICMVIFSMNVTFAAVGTGKKILYIPLDNRPCNLKQTVEVAKSLGYEIITPPEEILGTSTDKIGEPDKLWDWLFENAGEVNAAVISSDAMLYGSLSGSRKHDLTAEEILNRAKRFEDFSNKFSYIPTYVFGTVMRTPTLAGSTGAEPDYYKVYGQKIFDYTRLKDKAEVVGLSRSENKKFANYENEIPKVHLNDWLSRREKNFSANKYLIDLTARGYFQYLLIGCDDNHFYSQTHLESRNLSAYGLEKNLVKTQFQVMSGADELGMLMISRAINKDLNEIPFVAVGYNAGVGADTYPRLSNEKISDSIEGAIIAAGGLKIPAPERADFVVAVNTNFDGKTFTVDSKKNNIKSTTSTRNFMKLLKSYTEKNYPVGIADIKFSNGADNSLMEQLKKQDLQFKISAYGGWNTATNSAGFLIGAGVLTHFMNQHDKNHLLLTRYFDDWAYQANVRQKLTGGLFWTVPGDGNFYNMNEKRHGMENLTTDLLKNFAIENIKADVRNISANFTWNRTFECDISYDY